MCFTFCGSSEHSDRGRRTLINKWQKWIHWNGDAWRGWNKEIDNKQPIQTSLIQTRRASERVQPVSSSCTCATPHNHLYQMNPLHLATCRNCCPSFVLLLLFHSPSLPPPQKPLAGSRFDVCFLHHSSSSLLTHRSLSFCMFFFITPHVVNLLLKVMRWLVVI